MRAGALLTAEVAVLDDISRAPGEALNVLLRILNERKYHERPIPLWSAVATGNPTSAEFYNEPLDPATLDRFALQIRTQGLVAGGEWGDAADVVDSFGDSPYTKWDGSGEGEGTGSKGGSVAARDEEGEPVDLDVLNEALQHVPLTLAVRDALLTFLTRLRQRHALDHTNSLLTDRTFLTKAPRLIRAAAVVAGRDQAHPDDLHVLRLLTTFRVPEDVHENSVPDLIEEVAAEARQRIADEERERGGGSSGAGGGAGEGGGGDEGGNDDKGEPKNKDAASPPEDKSAGAKQASQTAKAPTKEEREEALKRAQSAEEEEAFGDHGVSPVLDAILKMISPTPNGQPKETNVDAASVRGLLTLIGVLRGQFERHNNVTRITHTDGVPRGWRRLRGLESFAEDAHPVDAATWLSRSGTGFSQLPDAVRRAKPNRGGALAICRDVSTSMHGLNAKYASSLALRVIELCQMRRMRVAVLEYSDTVNELRCGSQKAFFSNDYESLRTFARRLECGGLTDYEQPLQLTLDEFASDNRLRSPYVPKHVLFITDGHPTKGDRLCVEARKRMRRAGVQLHTLFVEPDAEADYPPLLAALADDSMGVRMRASVVDADAGVIDVSVVSDVNGGSGYGGWRSGGSKLSVDDSGFGAYPGLRQFFSAENR